MKVKREARKSVGWCKKNTEVKGKERGSENPFQ